MLNTHATLNRYVYDSAAMKVSLECTVYMHEGTESWLTPYFAEAVAMQAAQAHAELDPLADMFGARPDDSYAPIGSRSNPDDMLNILRFIKTKGDEPCPFFGEWTTVHRQGLQGVHPHFGHDSRQDFTVLPSIER